MEDCMKPAIRDGVSVLYREVDSGIELNFLVEQSSTIYPFSVDQNTLNCIQMFDGFHKIVEISESVGVSEASIADLIRLLDSYGFLQMESASNSYLVGRLERQAYFLSSFDPNNAQNMQDKICSAEVAVIGLGGVGSWVAYGLVLAGVKKLVLIDNDIVELSNLNRQCLYDLSSLGAYKINALSSKLQQINPELQVTLKMELITSMTECQTLVSNSSLVICCADFPGTDEINGIVSEACFRNNQPHILCGGYDGHLGFIGPTIIPGKCACWNCYEKTLDHQLLTAGYKNVQITPAQIKGGNLGAISAIVANYHVLEALKVLSGFSEPTLYNSIAEIDFLTYSIHRRNYHQRPDCKTCNQREKGNEMDTTKQFVTSDHLALESEDSETGDIVIFNSMTGRRVKLNEQSLHLLTQIRTPQTLQSLGKVYNLDEHGKELLGGSILTLIGESVLVWCDETVEEVKKSQQFQDSDIISEQAATFTRCPSGKLPDIKNGDIVILGAGIDFATTGKSGARSAPNKLREISAQFATYERDIFTRTNRGWYNADLNRMILTGKNFLDVGNVSHLLGESPETYYARTHRAVVKIVSQGGIPIILGGDHSISAPAIEGYMEVVNQPLTVVHLDAHTDLGEWVPGTTHHHGNVMRRLLHNCPLASLFQIGIRGFSGAPEKHARCTMFTQREVDTDIDKVLEVAPFGKSCYITIDIDVIDPVFAPGTGTPVPMGMHPHQLLKILGTIAQNNTVVGIDLVEVSPDQDSNNITSSLAFHQLMYLLGSAYDR